MSDTRNNLDLRAVTRVAVAAQVTDVQIFMGATRHVFDEAGEFTKQTGVEYFTGFSLSPIVAKQLVGALTHAMEQYEAQFGKIPVDPASKMRAGNV